MTFWSTGKSVADYSYEIEMLKKALFEADTVVIGAGAGLSVSAGLTYSGKRFEKYFSDFKEKYHISDMYSGGFYPYSSLEEYWAWWSRHIYYNRFVNAPKPVYENLLKLVKDKNYFVITTNVDHCFQKAGFDKSRLFYTQGDYGLWQCRKPCHNKTYDNEEIVRKMLEQQKDMKIPSHLIPVCPKCKEPMTMNLRCDNTFVEDEGWHAASRRYNDFLEKYSDIKILFLELGVGYNTSVIIKYPFWKMTLENPQATYVCINRGESAVPDEIKKQAYCIDDDIGKVLESIK